MPDHKASSVANMTDYRRPSSESDRADVAEGGVRSLPLAAAYLKNREGLLRFLRRRTGSPTAAQDLLNEIWLRLARVDPAGTPANPAAYLQSVAGNLAIDWQRRQRFRARIIVPEIEAREVSVEDAPSVEEQLQSREALAFLMSVIDDLPPRRKEAFLLYRVEGMPMKDVATRMGISERTVEHQVAAAMVQCRKRLAEAELWP